VGQQGAGRVPARQAKCLRHWFFQIVSAMVLAGILAGCGYMGEPLPPALKRPMRVTDLAAVERGSKIIIQFTIPKVTTEGLPIKKPEDIELRIGPGENPFNLEAWQRTSDRVPVDANGKAEAPAAKYYDKVVYINVNVHGDSGRPSGPSNWIILPVVPALPTPEGLEAADAPDAVRLEWHAAAGEFRIFRKLTGEQDLKQIGTSTKPTFVDGTIEYGKSYSYYVQSVEKIGDAYAESEISGVNAFKPEDHFAPATPGGVSAVPGTRSIDLVWERNTEKDFASYRIYRGGEKVAEGLTAPSYSDRDAKPGIKYEYQLSAVDTAGNESTKSPIVEAVIP
jgi:hypothetical protein